LNVPRYSDYSLFGKKSAEYASRRGDEPLVASLRNEKYYLSFAFQPIPGDDQQVCYTVVLCQANGDTVDSKTAIAKYAHWPFSAVLRDIEHAEALAQLFKRIQFSYKKHATKLAFVVGVGALHTLKCGVAVALGYKLRAHDIYTIGVTDAFHHFHGIVDEEYAAKARELGTDVPIVDPKASAGAKEVLGIAHLHTGAGFAGSRSKGSAKKSRSQTRNVHETTAVIFVSSGRGLTACDALAVTQAFILPSASADVSAAFPAGCNSAYGRVCKPKVRVIGDEPTEDDGWVTATRPK
jgi:hypothetical protein